MSRSPSTGAPFVSVLAHLPRRSIFVSTRRKTAEESQVSLPMPKGIEPPPSMPQQPRKSGLAARPGTQLRPLTSRAAASVCALWQVLHLDGGGARAAAVAALGRRAKYLKSFARLRRAREVPEAFRWRPRARFCVTVPMGGTWSGGSKRDKKILLHQSIDLDELYPTVPVAQIVRRRKYFLPKMRGYVWCTCRRPPSPKSLFQNVVDFPLPPKLYN